MHALSQKK